MLRKRSLLLLPRIRRAPGRASDTSYSSSQSGTAQVAELALPEAPAPRPSAAASGQYGNGGGNGGGEKKGILHRLTFEAGGGFNAPISSSVTYGFNLTVGGGMRFDPHFSTLIEYQFLDDKLPGALIAETNGEATGGHAHIWSFTVDPVVDLAPKATNDVYVTGGGGFYRKVTTFTFPMAQEFLLLLLLRCRICSGHCGPLLKQPGRV